MAAVVDLSWPFDRCSTGIYDLRSGRSKMSGTVADMASVFTSAHRKREGGILVIESNKSKRTTFLAPLILINTSVAATRENTSVTVTTIVEYREVKQDSSKTPALMKQYCVILFSCLLLACVCFLWD